MQWLVVGLGNPGGAYARTRHNVGFQVVDRLAVEAGAHFGADRFQTQAALADLSGIPILLLKPQTFMNLSGPSVAAWRGLLSLPETRLAVVHDDLDLVLGRVRVTGGAGPGGHRGVASVQEALGTQDFPRVRLGIGRPRESEDAADRVLEEFAAEELPVAADMLARAATAVQTLIRHGLALAMNRYNVWAHASGASA